jgi:ATP-dependent Clp protease ATP-binding subunit ClpB
MDMLIQRLVPLGLKLTYDTKCISKILKDTYDPQYGARPVRRYIQDQIEDHIADAMLSHKKLSHISISAIK